MKKTIALVLSMMLLFAACAALAEALEPMYATVGDAVAAAGDHPIVGGGDDYFAVVTEKDGVYYRSIAETDDKYMELQQAVWDADPEDMDAAFAAVDAYVDTLPIAYTEQFAAVPMEQAEMDALIGKTVGELRDEGYIDSESGTEGDDIVYVMHNGLFDYAFTVDADFDAYVKAQDDGSDGDFAVKSVALRGITSEACLKSMHLDGTIEEAPDPFAGYAELTADVLEMIGQVQNGEDVNVEERFAALKEKYPDLAESVDMYLEMYKALGAESLAAMLTPAE